MAQIIEMEPQTEHELVIGRIIAAPREAVWRCWVEEDLVVQWFTPAPWKTVSAKLDVRNGGRSEIVMESPDGEQYPNVGQFAEVVPYEKIITTDAYQGDWVPTEQPFMTAIMTLEDAPGGKTRYIARALHWNAETMKQHAEMGFLEGWSTAAEQLEQVARSLT